MGQGLCCLLGTSSPIARVSMIFICSSHLLTIARLWKSLLWKCPRTVSGLAQNVLFSHPYSDLISSLTVRWGTRSAGTRSKLWVPRPGHCPSQPIPKLNTARQTHLNPWQLEPVCNMFWWLQPVQKSSILAAASLPWLLLYFAASSSLSSGLGMASPPCISLQQV